MTITDELARPAPAAPVSSVLADLGRTPLADMQSAGAAALSETLNRVLPAPEVQQVPVAAFNSSI
ncbi:MAG TPA: FxSxx-COOH cyclophane-containing RiPP peptide [Streptosporangiaceae bacterium]|nr:FxSxx-COOH cyclophane-containing RiPP peptide [Streptosporangiaceae bacterium]